VVGQPSQSHFKHCQIKFPVMLLQNVKTTRQNTERTNSTIENRQLNGSRINVRIAVPMAVMMPPCHYSLSREG